MTIEEAIRSCLANYATFSGRARRSEYWYWNLCTGVISALLALLTGEDSLVVSFFSLIVLIPGLAVTWRRLHDTGRSGAWYLILLIPLVGAVLMLIWTCIDSDPGDNAYGPCPK